MSNKINISDKKDSDKKKVTKKFGTFKGVFVPSTEAILGTVLFLILPGLVIDVGLLPMLAIVILAHTITFSTSFSISDCATNLNNIGGGGMYALSRRSLGRAFGGSIGIMLYFAQAFSIAFYCIGFVEPLQTIFLPVFQKIGIFALQNLQTVGTDLMIDSDKINILRQKQVLAAIVFFIFFIIVMVGADFTLKIQSVILVILFLSILTIFLSPIIGFNYQGKEVFLKGFSGLNLFGLRNWGGGSAMAIFFLAFTQFFPAVTGIDAGVGMSGDLKDPRKSLVWGTFLAIILTFIVYLGTSIVFAFIDKNILFERYEFNQSILGIPKTKQLTDLFGIANIFPFNIFGIMILMGILFATSSSALSCFMTAPRTAQSLAKDKILPKFLSFLEKDFKKNGNEPRFATLATFFIAFIVILIGDINTAAMIVGVCFLIVYGWVNVSAFLERISKNPTFRPTSKGHWAISLYGFLAALTAICLFSWKIGIAIIVSQFIIFQLILKFKSENKLEGVWWGVLFSLVSKGLVALKKVVQGTKNWRPIITTILFQGDRIPKTIDSVHFTDDILPNIKSQEDEKLLLQSYRKDGTNYVLSLDLDNIKDIKIKHFEIWQALVRTGYIAPVRITYLADRIASYQGLVNQNIIHSNIKENNFIPINSTNISTSIININDPTQAVLSIIQASNPGGIDSNSILLDYSKKINTVQIVDKILSQNKNVFILKNGSKLKKHENIDIWWRGEKNGNLMVLLAYIINNSVDVRLRKSYKIRIIRKLAENENADVARDEMSDLMKKARLTGDVLTLLYSSEPFHETLIHVSKNADLIMMGLPGDVSVMEGIGKFFKLDEMFFDKEINKYDDLPALLFVKSASLMNLIEE